VVGTGDGQRRASYKGSAGPPILGDREGESRVPSDLANDDTAPPELGPSNKECTYRPSAVHPAHFVGPLNATTPPPAEGGASAGCVNRR